MQHLETTRFYLSSVRDVVSNRLSASSALSMSNYPRMKYLSRPEKTSHSEVLQNLIVAEAMALRRGHRLRRCMAREAGVGSRLFRHRVSFQWRGTRAEGSGSLPPGAPNNRHRFAGSAHGPTPGSRLHPEPTVCVATFEQRRTGTSLFPRLSKSLDRKEVKLLSAFMLMGTFGF